MCAALTLKETNSARFKANEPMDNNPKQMHFDVAMRERLRTAHKEAVDKGVGQFVFEGNIFVTDYAKYLIQFLDLELTQGVLDLEQT